MLIDLSQAFVFFREQEKIGFFLSEKTYSCSKDGTQLKFCLCDQSKNSGGKAIVIILIAVNVE